MKINSVIICEDTTSDFTPINIGKSFFDTHKNISILVKLPKITQTTEVVFTITSEYDNRDIIFTLPLPPNDKDTRYATCIINPIILIHNDLDKEYWNVNVSCLDATKNIKFLIKRYTTYIVPHNLLYLGHLFDLLA